MNKDNHVDGITLLLFYGVIVTLIALFIAEKLFSSDGQMFQVVAGLVTGFAGAFFGRIKPAKTDQTAAPTAPTPATQPPPTV